MAWGDDRRGQRKFGKRHTCTGVVRYPPQARWGRPTNTSGRKQVWSRRAAFQPMRLLGVRPCEDGGGSRPIVVPPYCSHSRCHSTNVQPRFLGGEGQAESRSQVRGSNGAVSHLQGLHRRLQLPQLAPRRLPHALLLALQRHVADRHRRRAHQHASQHLPHTLLPVVHHQRWSSWGSPWRCVRRPQATPRCSPSSPRCLLEPVPQCRRWQRRKQTLHRPYLHQREKRAASRQPERADR